MNIEFKFDIGDMVVLKEHMTYGQGIVENCIFDGKSRHSAYFVSFNGKEGSWIEEQKLSLSELKKVPVFPNDFTQDPVQETSADIRLINEDIIEGVKETKNGESYYYSYRGKQFVAVFRHEEDGIAIFVCTSKNIYTNIILWEN